MLGKLTVVVTCCLPHITLPLVSSHLQAYCLSANTRAMFRSFLPQSRAERQVLFLSSPLAWFLHHQPFSSYPSPHMSEKFFILGAGFYSRRPFPREYPAATSHITQPSIGSFIYQLSPVIIQGLTRAPSSDADMAGSPRSPVTQPKAQEEPSER